MACRIIWHTAIENETFPLFINQGKGLFRNASQESRLANLTRPMSGWSNGIVDLDNDGWKDLVVARSNVLDNIEEISSHFRYAEPNSVFRNLGNGQFEDVSATAGADFTRPAPHRGLAYGDLDNDGRMDLVVTALGAPGQRVPQRHRNAQSLDPAQACRNKKQPDGHWRADSGHH